MKLYKDGKIMQACEKDQMEICIDAGWSRTKPVEEAPVIEKDETDETGNDADDTVGDDVQDDVQDDAADETESKDSEPAAAPKKIVKPKVLKKKK